VRRVTYRLVGSPPPDRAAVGGDPGDQVVALGLQLGLVRDEVVRGGDLVDVIGWHRGVGLGQWASATATSSATSRPVDHEGRLKRLLRGV
jgi:hypothetical protein